MWRLYKYLSVVIFAGFIAFGIYFAVSSRAGWLTIVGESPIVLKESWECRWEKEADYRVVDLPAKIPSSGENGRLFVRNVLPQQSGSGLCLSFRTDQQTAEVYVGGKRIYVYDPVYPFQAGRVLPAAWHVVRLPEDSAGKEIFILLSSPFAQYRGVVSEISLGTKSALIFSQIRQNEIGLMAAMLALVLGIVIVTLCLMLHSLNQRCRNVLHLGLFVLLMGAWLLLSNPVIQLGLPNPYLVYVLTVYCQYLLPIPFLSYFVTTYQGAGMKPLNAMIGLFLGFFMLTAGLHLFRLASLLAALPIYLAMLAVALVWMFIIALRRAVKGEKKILSFLCGFGLFALFSLFDLVKYIAYTYCYSDFPWLDRAYQATSMLFFSKIGLFLFLVFLLVSFDGYIDKIYAQSINSVFLSKMAYTDFLTGLNNQNSFQSDIALLNSQLTSDSLPPKTKIWMVMFDLNCLKETNDTMGHSFGDMIIKLTARTISECFGSMGKIYRLGGDEFIAVISSPTDFPMDDCVQRFTGMIERNNREGKIPISISVGYVQYQPETDEDLVGTFRRADAKMYQNKSEYKSRKSCRQEDVTIRE